MKMKPHRPGIGRLVAALALTIAILGASLSIVAYQAHLAKPSVSILDSSAISSSESGSATAQTSSGASGQEAVSISRTEQGTSTEVILSPCNCTADISQKAWPEFPSLSALISSSETVIVATVTAQDTIGVNDSAMFGPGYPSA